VRWKRLIDHTVRLIAGGSAVDDEPLVEAAGSAVIERYPGSWAGDLTPVVADLKQRQFHVLAVLGGARPDVRLPAESYWLSTNAKVEPGADVDLREVPVRNRLLIVVRLERSLDGIPHSVVISQEGRAVPERLRPEGGADEVLAGRSARRDLARSGRLAAERR